MTHQAVIMGILHRVYERHVRLYIHTTLVPTPTGVAKGAWRDSKVRKNVCKHQRL